MMISDYPGCHEQVSEMMERFGAASPGVMGGFARLHKAAVADGALNARVKELSSAGS